jgi:hypothetical protein
MLLVLLNLGITIERHSNYGTENEVKKQFLEQKLEIHFLEKKNVTTHTKKINFDVTFM